MMRGEAYSVSVLRHAHWGAAALLGSLKVLLAIVLMSAYTENCAPGTLYAGCPEVKLPRSYVERMGVVAIPNVFTYQVAADLLVFVLVVLVAKLIYYMRFRLKRGPSFSLDATLADRRNSAVAISLAAFTFALGLGVSGVVSCPDESSAGRHAATTVLWSAIGCVLLLLAFAISDGVLLIKISNTDHLLDDNVAVASFEGGSFVACGVILRAALTGGGDDFATGLALTCIFWALAQLLLLLTAYVYRCATSFDDWNELKSGNAAAGVSGGATLVALAVITAYPMPMYASLLIVVPVALVGLLALMIMRKIVDKFVLPGEPLDSEIMNDKNWGAAVIEGAVVIGIAFISNRYVPHPGPPDVFDVCG